jgi:hypothetical protein
MGRPPKVIPSIEKAISLPSDIVAKVDLILWSELENRVPYGAWTRYLETLIRDDLQKRTVAHG